MKWLGKILLHPKELHDLENIKKRVISTHGPVTFELKDSPSSGEIFNKFYELHVFEDIDPTASPSTEGTAAEEEVYGNDCPNGACS